MTTQKHKDFIAEPMGFKKITEIAGIGVVYGDKLMLRGFVHAYILLGQFLLRKKKEQVFSSWLMSNFQINKRYAKSCFNLNSTMP
jgi:hypothetical protein